MSKLYRYQKRAIKFALERNARCGLFLEMGTGKTRVAIETARRLPDAKKIVVVAPLSAAGVWRREVRKWAPEAATVSCTTGSIAKRAAKLKRVRLREYTRRVFVIVGYESFWREPLRSELLKYHAALYIYDEAHRLKGRGTKQSRFAHTIANEDRRHILALTGTPMPNGLEDAFSVFKSIDPTVLGTRWIDFEDRYVIRGGFQRYQIIGYRNEAELAAKIALHSFRITKAEAFDLPEQVDVQVPVIISAKARAIYNKLRKEAIAEIDGFQGKGTAISRIVLTNVIRLQQVASGFVKVEDGRILDFDTAKQDALTDLLRDAIPSAQRVVVFCRFTHDVDAVLDAVARLRGVESYQIDGRVKPKQREAQIRDFRRKNKPAVLVGQIQVTSHAIDLTCAHVGVFYSRDYSLLHYDQARGRLHRHGQKEKVTYYHLVAAQTIDAKILQALVKKDELQRKLLDKHRAKKFFS